MSFYTADDFLDRLLEPEQRDAFGIVVSYSVKAKLYLGALGGELSAELPFILMHPKVSSTGQNGKRPFLERNTPSRTSALLVLFLVGR